MALPDLVFGGWGERGSTSVSGLEKQKNTRPGRSSLLEPSPCRASAVLRCGLPVWPQHTGRLQLPGPSVRSAILLHPASWASSPADNRPRDAENPWLVSFFLRDLLTRVVPATGWLPSVLAPT